MWVGFRVFTGVGTVLGANDGFAKGLAVSSAVGSAVGSAIGNAVGTAEGRAVGSTVGTAEGLVDRENGSCVGLRVGCTEKILFRRSLLTTVVPAHCPSPVQPCWIVKLEQN